MAISRTHFIHRLLLSIASTHSELPPVSLGRSQSGVGFAFESSAWRQCAMRTLVLRTCVRQAGDADFISLLNEVRVGTLSARAHAALAACNVERKGAPVDGIMPTRLYCVNVNVDEENAIELDKLPVHSALPHDESR